MMEILSSTLLVLAMAQGATATADARERALREEWRGRTVTLEEPLFTVEYPTASAVLPGQAATVTQGIVVVRPDGGIHYAARPGGIDVTETTPERLVQRITAATAGPKAPVGASGRTAASRPATLLRYDVGTEMNVGDVEVAGRWVTVTLNDWFHTGGPPTTTLRLEWPSDVTRETPSRRELDAAMGRVLAWSTGVTAPASVPSRRAGTPPRTSEPPSAAVDGPPPAAPAPGPPAGSSPDARVSVPFSIGELVPLHGSAGPMCLTGVTFDTLEEEPSRVGRLVRRDSELHTTLRAQFTIEPGCPGAEPAFGRWKFSFTVTLLDGSGAVMASIDKQLGDGDIAGKVLRFTTRVHRAVIAASKTADIAVVARRARPGLSM